MTYQNCEIHDFLKFRCYKLYKDILHLSLNFMIFQNVQFFDMKFRKSKITKIKNPIANSVRAARTRVLQPVVRGSDFWRLSPRGLKFW